MPQERELEGSHRHLIESA